MTFKTAAKSFGTGLANAAICVSNVNLDTRINEIDTEIETLQAQIDKLNEERSHLDNRRLSYR